MAGGAVPRPSRQKGLALVAVLWATALLAVLAASFTQSTRTETKLAHNLLRNSQAEALADAGVSRAILALLEDDPARRRRLDGSAAALEFGGGTITVAIQDEAGKIDLNAAPTALLRGLFESLGETPRASAALAQRIADFRDADDIARSEGAEAADYRAAGLGHTAKNRAFELRQELAQVLGMTQGLLARALPLVTVHSEQAGIDRRVAPVGVLRALPGVDGGELEALLAARGDPERDLAAAPLPPLTGVASYLDASKRRVFTIRSDAATPDGARFVREAVVRLTRRPGQPYETLRWRRGLAGPEDGGASPRD